MNWIARLSLAARLTLLFVFLSLVVLGTVGYTLYQGLTTQLVLRDDAALITRVDQIRTLVDDANTVQTVRDKPHLFENMLGNHEALLVLRFAGQKPLIEVNPQHRAIPRLAAVPQDARLTLAAVDHSIDPDGVPFIAVAAIAHTGDPQGDLQILAGRAMTERTRLLHVYRNWMVVLISAAVLLVALSAYGLVRLGLKPLRQLARQTDAIGIANLDARLMHGAAPHELAPLIRAFNAMLERLSKGFMQMSQLSADMAHDLRTPINNLLGQTEVALGQRRNADYYERLLASNFEEFQRLSRMMDSMLFLARSEQPDTTIDRVWIKIEDEFARIVDYFDGLCEERDLRLVCTGSGKLWADAVLLRRALANLIANAIQYADAGSTITLGSMEHADGTALWVENHGPVIAADHLPHLFDRFYRADAARRGSSQASGLGLSIVHSIMNLHHGERMVESTFEQTRFVLVFPPPPPG